MAAISALMLSESPLHRDPRDGNHTPATPHAPSRITSPSSNETTRYTISNEAIHLARPAPIQGAVHIDNKSPVVQPTTTREMVQDSSDVMELDENQIEEDSDNDTEQGDAASGTRKKKGQRFFCTKYPPCNLSFTRSEHLARHIRKHTGERPFQCHCNRRFSRLDNLRQHAQTVHVNEEIPTDSLAATGTRFQRQIRTDRVRPTGRPRTSTMSSSGSHSRGHSRNLSASSIGSTSSSYSTSTIDLRRRPPPLIMAGDGRPKLGIDTPSTPPSQFASYSSHSPHDINTPTSATFSAVDGSPGFGSGIGSPLARGNSFSNSRAPARRLSVPSGTNPYQSPYGQPYAPPYNNPTNFPNGGMQPYPSAMVSPTNSTFSSYGPGPGFHVPPGEDWRRRTWHPSTYSGMNLNYQRPATSGLSYSQTPDAPQPAFAQHAIAAAGHAPRLPGIESFDHVQQQHTTPPRQKLPSITGSSGPPTLMPPVELESHAPRVQASTDTLRPIKHTESEESVSTDRRDSTDQMQLLDSQAKIRFAAATRHPMGPPPSAMTQQQIIQETPSLQSSNHRAKRNGWYNGPLHTARTSPEDSSSSEGVPTPGTSGVDIQPAIVHSNGIVEPHHAIVAVDGNNNVSL